MDLTALTDEALDQLRRDVLTEQERRATVETAPQRADTLSLRYLRAVGRLPDRSDGAPVEWVQPTGAHDAYPEGSVVLHGGAEWVSLTPANVWEPGVSGWRENVTEGSAPAEWVQPTGVHDAYQTGDRVTFEGQVYRSLIDGNTWSPTAYPQGWEAQTA